MTVGWQDLDTLVDALRDANPRVDPRALNDAELKELAEQLEGFDGSAAPPPGPRVSSSVSSPARGTTPPGEASTARPGTAPATPPWATWSCAGVHSPTTAAAGECLTRLVPATRRWLESLDALRPGQEAVAPRWEAGVQPLLLSLGK